jgi:hypothetical protein
VLDAEAEEGEVDDRAALAALARAAFARHPQRLLAFCVGALAKPEGRGGGGRGERAARRGARLVLTRVALAPPRPLRGGGGGGGSSGRAPRVGGPDCWLAAVLKRDEGLQAWVTQAAGAISGELTAFCVGGERAFALWLRCSAPQCRSCPLHLPAPAQTRARRVPL